MKPLDFSLETVKHPVVLRVPGSAALSFELRELTAAGRDTYLDRLNARLQIGKDGNAAGLKRFEGMQAELLTLCLFHTDGKQTVTAQEIQKWPASVVNDLFKAAQEINHLNEEKAEPKND